MFGEGVQFAGEAAGPVGHAGGSVAGGGPAGGVSGGESEQEAFGLFVSRPRTARNCHPRGPGLPWGAFAVDGLGWWALRVLLTFGG
ncbi:hypothetical protein GCM10010270_48790 [Streptomyces violaceus]|nr:hypothetical protein GCM10010270_48790 [Streptomyces janthinus]